MSLATEVRRPEPHRLPADLIDAPAPVTKALTAAVEAGRVLTDARTQQAAAKASIAQADQADQAADTAAVAAGKPLPDAKAGPKAREAAAVAERKLVAADANYDEKVKQLTAVIGSNAEEWLSVLRKQWERTVADLARSLEDFARSRATLKALDGTLSKVGDFADGGYDARIEGFPTTAQIETGASEPERIRAEVISGVRGSRRFGVNEHEVDRIIVELGLIALGEKPWSPSVNVGHEKDGPPSSEGERALGAFFGRGNG
jgi:hypothetical protein